MNGLWDKGTQYDRKVMLTINLINEFNEFMILIGCMLRFIDDVYTYNIMILFACEHDTDYLPSRRLSARSFQSHTKVITWSQCNGYNTCILIWCLRRQNKERK